MPSPQQTIETPDTAFKQTPSSKLPTRLTDDFVYTYYKPEFDIDDTRRCSAASCGSILHICWILECTSNWYARNYVLF